MPTDREGQLLVEARRHPDVFAELYELTERRMVRYFYRRTACPATAADLTSETFAAALDGLRRYDPKKGSGMQWLFGIANHLLLRWQRHERVEQTARRKLGLRIEVGDAVDLEEIETLVDFAQLAAPLAAALDGLTDGVRDAVRLRILEQLDYEEVARRLQCTPGTARVRVSRGLERLGHDLGGSWARR